MNIGRNSMTVSRNNVGARLHRDEGGSLDKEGNIKRCVSTGHRRGRHGGNFLWCRRATNFLHETPGGGLLVETTM